MKVADLVAELRITLAPETARALEALGWRPPADSSAPEDCCTATSAPWLPCPAHHRGTAADPSVTAAARRAKEFSETVDRAIAMKRELEALKSVEIAWLIEMPFEVPRWWEGSAWTTDSRRAVRFARREDAERARREWLPRVDSADAIVTEHQWG